MANNLLRIKNAMRREYRVLNVGPICMGEYSDLTKSIDQYLNKQAILDIRPLIKKTKIDAKNKR